MGRLPVKRFLLFVSAIVAAVAAMMLANDALNKRLALSSHSSPQYKMWRLFANPEKGEIPILGSSRAEAGFAPKEISEEAFNYGLSGSTFRETAFHLEEVLSRKDCRLAIVNLDPWGLGAASSFIGDYRFAAGAGRVRREPLARLPALERIPGVRSHGRTRLALSDWLNERLAVTKTMERGAILQRISRSADEWKIIASKSPDEYQFAVDAATKAILERLLRSNGSCQIVFVLSPVSQIWLGRFHRFQELRSLVAWLESFDRVAVLAFLSPGEGYGMEEFMDPTHLNEHGARRFSRELRTALLARGLL